MSRSIVSRVRLTSVIALAIVCFPLVAAAEGGGVRFSYEKVEIGTATDWVLVPQPDKRLNGKASSSLLKKAFAALRKDKGATYGKSSIKVSGSPPRARVTVNIDKKVSRYALIIMAETVYTMTELGAESVTFPGYGKNLKREDVPFAAYSLTIPLWKAVGRVSSSQVHVRMPDGALVPSDDIGRRWKRNDAKLRQMVYDYLETDDVYTVTSVAKRLPGLKIPYAKQVAALLKNDSTAVQKTALDVLEGERNDKSVLEAVVAYMNDQKKDDLARKAAEFLGEAKSSKYSVWKDYFLLERGSGKEKIAAAKSLAKSKDDRTVDRLVDALDEKSTKVSAAAADALASLDADEAQREALKNSKINAGVRLDIARDLAKDSQSSSAIPGLVYVAKNGPDYEGRDALEKLGKLKGSDAREAVEGFLDSDKEYLRLAAAEVLVDVGSDDSLDAIASAIKKGKNADELEESGYRIMAAQSESQIMDRTRDSNTLIKRMAYRALGERARKKGGSSKAFGVLEGGTSSRDPLIRGAAARAIGTFGNKAVSILKKMVDDKSADVRADVAVGIGYLPEGKLADELKKLLGDSAPQVRASAATAMARRGEAFAWDEIKKLTKSKNDEERAAAMAALARLVSRDDAQGVREVVSMLSGAVTDNAEVVRKTAVRELGTFSIDKAVTAIALQLGSDEPDMRVAAVEALGETGNKSATELVANMLNDPNRNVREAAIASLADLKDGSAKSALQARAKKEDDPELVDMIKKTLKKL
jgi:HEAT repeat protein